MSLPQRSQCCILPACLPACMPRYAIQGSKSTAPGNTPYALARVPGGGDPTPAPITHPQPPGCVTAALDMSWQKDGLKLPLASALCVCSSPARRCRPPAGSAAYCTVNFCSHPVSRALRAAHNPSSTAPLHQLHSAAKRRLVPEPGSQAAGRAVRAAPKQCAPMRLSWSVPGTRRPPWRGRARKAPG